MDEKKSTIIEKGFELFSLYGIRSVTMQDLGRELGMSKKTLYHYFNNKSDLVTEVMENTINNIMQELKEDPGNDINAVEEFFIHRRELLKKLSRQNTAIAFDLRKYYPDLFNKLKEIRREALYSAHKKNLEKGKKQGVYRRDVDTDFISRLMTGGHVFTFDPVYGIFSEEELLSPKFRNNLFQYHFRGICTEKGLKIFNDLMQQPDQNDNKI
ncbi:MAG: TetR/AcrR family transcriptional regulator [Marinilabilia sp.]